MEREGGDSSDDKRYTAHTAGKKIREQDDGQRQEEEGHARMTVKAALFYADGVLVASTYLGWTQSVFETLTGLFDQVGLQKKIH